jgi:hypothetical protein
MYSLEQLRTLNENYGTIFITFGQPSCPHAALLVDIRGTGINTEYLVDDPAKMNPEWLNQTEFVRQEPNHRNFFPKGPIVVFPKQNK